MTEKKRGRGRPKGSKNKVKKGKNVADAAVEPVEADETVDTDLEAEEGCDEAECDDKDNE